MANNVIGQILGGEKKVFDGVETVADVRAKMSAGAYAASINGDSATDSDSLEDGDYVSFAQAVKGGC